MANVKAERIGNSRKPGRLEILRESLSLSLDRKTANRIHKARKEAQEGKTTSLRSFIK